MSRFFTSRIIITSLLVLIGLILLIIAFEGGQAVGYSKALFSCRWSDNYEQNFAGPARPFRGAHPDDFLNANGTSGTVISVGPSKITIENNNDTEQTVMIATSTVIRELDTTVTVDSIHQGDRITVLGSPSDAGEIDAKFIRVFSSK